MRQLKIGTSSVRGVVGEALTLARLESGAPEAAAETVDLADLVADVAEDARFEARAAGRSLALQSVDKLLVRGHSELLHRAVENVVRNAVKYTAGGTEVEVDLYMAGDRAVLAVSDRGPGIPPDELERVFEPFYRRAGASADPLRCSLLRPHVLHHRRLPPVLLPSQLFDGQAHAVPHGVGRDHLHAEGSALVGRQPP